MVDVDPCSCLVHCTLCFLANCLDVFFGILNWKFQLFKLVVGLMLLIIVALICILALFFHIW